MCSLFCPVVSHRAIIYTLSDVTGNTNHADTSGTQSSMKTQSMDKQCLWENMLRANTMCHYSVILPEASMTDILTRTLLSSGH